MHAIEEAFGQGCNLYEVLNCEADADKAKLRKSYYRTALKVHPDKNPNDPKAAKSFQAVSLAYQILQNPELRQEYDETGVIPHNDALDDEAHGDGDDTSVDTWKQYFDQIFGKVTVSKIDDFAQKYKCSDEECRDVLKEFKKHKGNLLKMLEFVMLSEPRDALRWVDDYLRPAMENGEADTTFREAMEKSLHKINKIIEKENTERNKKDDSDEATETEDDDNDKAEEATPTKKRRISNSKAKSSLSSSSSSKKKKMTKKDTKIDKKENNMDDLIAQIQNKNKRGAAGGGNVLANLGARYGVSMDDDPLSDTDFAKARTQMEKKRRKRR